MTPEEILRAVYNRGYVDGEPLAMYDKPDQMSIAEAIAAIERIRVEDRLKAYNDAYSMAGYGRQPLSDALNDLEDYIFSEIERLQSKLENNQ